MAAVKGAVLELAYTLSHDGAVAAVARTRLCPYDFDQGRVRRLTPEEVTAQARRIFVRAHRTLGILESTSPRGKRGGRP